MDSPRPKPELLAPAGDRECIRAAVENGADAVYFGLNVGLNARARAQNLPLSELPEVMTDLHRRGVKGYVTLNTLVFTDELDHAESLVRSIAAAGVDAVLVQDPGLARVIRDVTPELAIHASTQMTMTSAECIREIEDLGIERVVLARELSVAEIRDISKDTSLELEAFVHGALCVAYSGQCLTSESLGGRSANRGQCAQACRLPYDLVCDGEDVDLGAMKYLLSPQDLAAYALAADLIDAGVSCFKIEGRLKTPEYVANITRHYRAAIDAAVSRQPSPVSDDDVREMELSFSRGFSPGWLGGCDHKMLVPGLSSSKRGVLLGEVVSVGRRGVTVRLSAPVKPGDGVVFEGDRAAGEEQGGRVLQARPFSPGKPLAGHPPSPAELVELGFHSDSVDLQRLQPGLRIWKTDDPELTARLRRSFKSADPIRRIPLSLEVVAIAGQPLEVTAVTATGHSVSVVSPEPLAPARKHPLTTAAIEEQFGRLGASAYELAAVAARIEGAPMLPLSVSSRLRHELIAALEKRESAGPRRSLSPGSAVARLRQSIPSFSRRPVSAPEPSVLVRSLAQLENVLSRGVRDILCDFADITHYTAAVQAGKAAGIQVTIATPRIQKPGEMGLFRRMAKDAPSAVLVRNLAGLRFFGELGLPCHADFSFNVTNELSAHWLMSRGARSVTASFDLNRDQLRDLVAAVPPDWLEVVIHQHMPMFHMEHCVFCAVLSPGTNKTNCGRPCDHHEVKLRDRVGMEHPLTADVGCRNTLFNAQAQSGAEAVPELLAAGISRFRIELLDESPGEIDRVLQLYRQLLAGAIPASEVWSQLKALNRVGVTRGTLEARRDPLAIL